MRKEREQGSLHEKLETAKRMKEDGVEYNIIAKYTNLSKDEIDNL